MNSISVYNFFFHPMEATHPQSIRVASVITIVTLSILTAGIFLFVFGAIQLKDRNIKVNQAPTRETVIFQTVVVEPKRQPEGNQKLEKLKTQHANQLQEFEKWAATNEWEKFADAHYDWWMFPINRQSRGHGDTYAITPAEIEVLKADPHFMQRYRRGVELVVKSWGWDLNSYKQVAHPAPRQQWTGYGVRLGKMADSLFLFGEQDLYRKLKLFYGTVCVPYSRLEDWVHNALSR